MATDSPNVPCEWDLLVGKTPQASVQYITYRVLQWNDNTKSGCWNRKTADWNRGDTARETGCWLSMGKCQLDNKVKRRRLQTLSLYLDLHVKATVVLTMTINLRACYNICVIVFHWGTELIHSDFFEWLRAARYTGSDNAWISTRLCHQWLLS